MFAKGAVTTKASSAVSIIPDYVREMSKKDFEEEQLAAIGDDIEQLAVSGDVPSVEHNAAHDRRKLCNSLCYEKIVTLVAEGELGSTNDIFQMHGTEEFQFNTLQRSTQEYIANRIAAERYFAEVFGLDFSNEPMNDLMKTRKEASFFGYILNPKLDLRIYTVSSSSQGVVQPRGRQKVSAGGWLVRLNQEQTLGGEYGARDENRGKPYPEGTILVFGDYFVRSFMESSVERVVDGKKVKSVEIVPTGENYIIAYRSRKPFIPTVDLILPINLHIENAALGKGVSTGTIEARHLKVVEPEKKQASVNVEICETWKFPGSLLDSE